MAVWRRCFTILVGQREANQEPNEVIALELRRGAEVMDRLFS
jgi:hypothetical protein